MRIELVQTSGACPEQYDAYYGERIVGYLRLRWGHFTVDYYHSSGERIRVYSKSLDDDMTGLFEAGERELYLQMALLSISYALYMNQSNHPFDKMVSVFESLSCTNV